MSAFFGSIWKWLAAAAGVAAGVLYALWKVADAQKEKARARADREEAKRRGLEATQEVERDVDRSVNQARRRAEEVERENRERRRAGDRPDEYGDPRLRDED